MRCNVIQNIKKYWTCIHLIAIDSVVIIIPKIVILFIHYTIKRRHLYYKFYCSAFFYLIPNFKIN